MRKTVKRKNYYLDEVAIAQARRILGTKTETETIQKALELVVDEARLAQALKNLPTGEKDTSMIRLPADRKIIFDTNVYLEAIAMLCTLNGEDFRLIARYETFPALQEFVWAREPGVCLSPLRRTPR